MFLLQPSRLYPIAFFRHSVPTTRVQKPLPEVPRRFVAIVSRATSDNMQRSIYSSAEVRVKSLRRPVLYFLCVCALIFSASRIATAQQVDPKTYGGMKWRLIGPFRGGRAITVAGVPSQPYTYYFGAVSGGVWKTTDGGNTWDPLTDKQGFSSIGAIAVADSDPNVIYAGSGEACIRGNISFGDGVYKSTDAGKTWTNVGLKDTRHIGDV